VAYLRFDQSFADPCAYGLLIESFPALEQLILVLGENCIPSGPSTTSSANGARFLSAIWSLRSATNFTVALIVLANRR
jgi:hypothetical protein